MDEVTNRNSILLLAIARTQKSCLEIHWLFRRNKVKIATTGNFGKRQPDLETAKLCLDLSLHSLHCQKGPKSINLHRKIKLVVAKGRWKALAALRRLRGMQ
jgi:hypothetical protein